MKEQGSDKTKVFVKALTSLEEALADPIEKPRDIAGIIQSFEFTYETAWKALKARLATEGHEVGTAREAISTAYQLKLLDREETWLAMIDDRNLTTHTYNEDLARKMIERIRKDYVSVFRTLKKALG